MFGGQLFRIFHEMFVRVCQPAALVRIFQNISEYFRIFHDLFVRVCQPAALERTPMALRHLRQACLCFIPPLNSSLCDPPSSLILLELVAFALHIPTGDSPALDRDIWGPRQ